MLQLHDIPTMHDRTTRLWHRDAGSQADAEDSSEPLDKFMEIAIAQHRANFDLWHEEDTARDPYATDGSIASVKHAIDILNQRRNDLVETMDGILLSLAGEQNPAAPLHSESPGLIVDRLSILALKVFHTREETLRTTASEVQRQKNVARLAVLEEQRADLAACLNALWEQVLAGHRRFKLYRQMKMYNDPELNPVLYGKSRG